MRFIRGDSLREAIRRFHGAAQQARRDPGRSTLELRELLGRFIDVCDAVAYAHSRGVLHRDLKPGNIMLGRYGETLVVDWGLAKALDEPEPAGGTEQADLPLRPGSGSALEPTLAGSAVGTPGYMSPEQVDGRVGALGVWSDVYCLGATLYHLLTGHAPCESEQPGEIYQKVLAGAIPRPRSLAPRVAPALEAICLKALALKPEDRYGSAEALRADLERWLADEPVTAYAEPLMIRARRWMRRHRSLVTSAAAVLVFGLIGLAGFATVLAGKNGELKKANEKVSAALEAERAANEKTARALEAETQAKQQKEEALTQSEEARKRAEAVLGFLKDDVLATARPEGQGGGLGVDVTVRKAVDAAERKIANAFQDQPLVEADVRDTLGATYWYLGEAALAIRQLERALELRRSKLGPDHHDTLRSRNHLASAYWSAGRTDEAIRMHETTLALQESTLGRDHPDTLATRDNLAAAYYNAGRIAEAVALQEVNLKLSESRLGPDHPGTLTCRDNLASGYRAAGRTAEALALQEANLRLFEAKLGRDHPDTLISRDNLAHVYHVVGRTAEALALQEANLRLFEAKLGPDHPDTLTSRNNLATAYAAAGRTPEAIPLHEANLKLREAKLGPDHHDTLSSRINLALAYWSSGRTDDAIELLEATLKLSESRLGPDHPVTLTSRNNLANAYTASKQFAQAETLLRDGLERDRKRFGAADPRTAGAMAQLGSNLIQQRKWTEAESILRECLAVREKAQPDDWSTFYTRSLLGSSLIGQNKLVEAEPLILAGYEGLKVRAARMPPQAKPRLAEAAERLVRLYGAWGKPDKAVLWKTKLGLADLPDEVFAGP
jgi:hypothetical protein